MKEKFLITDIVDESLVKGLEKYGFDVDYKPKINQSEVEVIIKNYHGIVIATRIKIGADILEKANCLKWILRAGSGMENVDVKSAEQKNIVCINSPEGNQNAVAEHCVGLLIGLLHHIPFAFQEIKNGNWATEKFRVNELTGKTIGIIGYGNTGSAFASRLKNFNVKILAFDKYKTEFSDDQVIESTMEQIFSEADIVSLHVPLTSETFEMINHSYIQKFSKSIYLINTSRGKIVDESDLYKNLVKGKICGAALDVIYEEPGSEFKISTESKIQKLVETNRVIITPHIAGKSFFSRLNFAEVLLQKLFHKM